MQFLVVWRHKTADSAKNASITVDILSALSGAKFAKIFDNTFVVSVDDIDQYELIYSKLLGVVRSNPSTIQFVCTPPMPESSYKGWLPKSVWAELNRVSRGDADGH